MPGVVWFGLIAGGVVTVGMIFALQIRRTPRELILAGLFSALIAFLLFLIWDFDAPYSRGITATAEPFLTLFPEAGLTSPPANGGDGGGSPARDPGGRTATPRPSPGRGNNDPPGGPQRCPIRTTAIARTRAPS